MNTKLLYRLAWKEARSLRALWLTLLAAAALLQVGFVSLFEQGLERTDWLVGVALWVPSIYGLACAVISFAGEREDGTDQLLCRLAPPPPTLFGVKFAVVVATTTAMFAALYPLTMLVGAQFVTGFSDTVHQFFFGSPNKRFFVLSWTLDFLSLGVLSSLLFLRVLPCLVTTVMATSLLPLNMIWTIEGRLPNSFDWAIRLGVVPLLALLASLWLVQTWDENRWPRFIERLLGVWGRVTSKSERLTDSSRVTGHLSGSCRVLLRPFGLCFPDEWLPTWRREVRRLLWLEWRAAWKVSLGLVVAGSVVLIGLVSTTGSQTDLRFAISILPLILATVVFVLGVWSFHGEQREQRFRFFATHGASPVAMWAVKHLVWLSCAIVAVVALLGISTMVSEKAILEKEIMEGGMRGVVDAARDRRMGWNETNPVEPLNRFVFCLSNATKTSLDLVDNPKYLPSSWPLISLMILSIGRGLIAVWLCFCVGQLVSLVIPRAVTSVLVGLLLLGATVTWWLMISTYRVPLVIAVLPVLIGLLAATWGRMSDWLEERSSWRRWLRLAVTVAAPMALAFVGMAAYRVYEVPFVELPWRSTGLMTSTAEARKTGEDWVRLSERLESPWGSEDAPKKLTNGDYPPVVDIDHNHIDSVHWYGFAERKWLTRNVALLEEALQLANRTECVMPKSWDPFDGRKGKQFKQVALLLKMSAFESLANHRLDEAKQRALALYQFGRQLGPSHGGRDQWYRGRDVQKAALHVLREWAMSADQTPETLLAALGRSARGESDSIAQLVRAAGPFVVDPQENLRAEYAFSAEMQDQRWRDAASPHRWAFWEKWREDRLLNVLAAEGADNIRRSMREDPWPDRRYFHDSYDRLLRNMEEDPDRIWYSLEPMSRGQRWQQTAPQVTLGWSWTEYEVKNFYLPTWASLEAHRRGLWLTIALQAYRLQHGKLPERLDELVGPFMDRLPTDPFCGQAFEYWATGIPIELRSDDRRLPPNTPYISIPGVRGIRSEPVAKEYQNAFGPFKVKPHINDDVNWITVFSNQYGAGQSFDAVGNYERNRFSLAPSF